MTYKELQAQSNALAWGLRDVGVRKGDRVAISMGNCVEYAIVGVPRQMLRDWKEVGREDEKGLMGAGDV